MLLFVASPGGLGRFATFPGPDPVPLILLGQNCSKLSFPAPVDSTGGLFVVAVTVLLGAALLALALAAAPRMLVVPPALLVSGVNLTAFFWGGAAVATARGVMTGGRAGIDIGVGVRVAAGAGALFTTGVILGLLAANFGTLGLAALGVWPLPLPCF